MASALHIWIITSGRRGDIVQCEAIAKRLSSHIIHKTVTPAKPWQWLMPHGPVDPAEAHKIEPPFPDLIIAASRYSVPYARKIHKKSGGRTRVLFMKYPHMDISSFAMIWTPAHDNRPGINTIETLTAPHLVTPENLVACRSNPISAITALPGPRLGVLLGGNTRKVSYGEREIMAFCKKLKSASGFRSLMASGSRRTPDTLLDALKLSSPCENTFIWEGKDHNPYFDILANADALLVTGDSHNLVSEALAASCPVHVFKPAKNPAKFNWTLNRLEEEGLILPQSTVISPGQSKPFDETPRIVEEIKNRLI